MSDPSVRCAIFNYTCPWPAKHTLSDGRPCCERHWAMATDEQKGKEREPVGRSEMAFIRAARRRAIKRRKAARKNMRPAAANKPSFVQAKG